MESIHLEGNQVLIPEVITTELVTHNDPFNPSDISVLIVNPGISCYSLLENYKYDIEYYDIVISRNQEIIDVDFIVEKGDIVSLLLVPKGGGGGAKTMILGAIITIIGAVLFYTGVAAPLGVMMMKVGVGMMLSGALMSLFPPTVPTTMPGLSSYDQSTTYGWNVQGNSIAQGNSVPILYGTMKITPQYIGKYLEVSNNNQILKILLGLGEGPFDNITEITVNDTPISSFSDTYHEYRLGTNNQTVISDFNDTWSDQGISKKLTNTSTWSYALTSGDAVTSLGVGISCPQGLYYANDTGGMDSYSVYIDVEYRPVGGVWANLLDSGYVVDTMFYYVDQNPTVGVNYGTFWYNPGVYADATGPYDVYAQQIVGKYSSQPSTTPIFMGTVTTLPADVTGRALFMGQNAWAVTRRYSASSYFTITGNQPSAIRRTFKATGLPPAQYEVRVRFYQNPATSSRYGSATYFEALQEAISDDFTYPNTALLALSMKATDQLSGGFPKVTCIASRTTGTYGRLDNPAWAAMDLLMNSRYGAGIPLSRIDFQVFSDWATYCNTEGFTINMYIDQSLSLVQNLQLIGQLGRGRIIQYGSTFSVIVDKPNIIPTQGFLFSMGNIIQNSFSEVFLPLKDRANAVEVTYYDANNDYERTTIEVTQGNYDLVNIVNKVQLNLLGCTSKEQALRQAKYHLNQNRYLTITSTWEASIDSIHCKVGDIVNVAHDVPQWGYSGRITNNTTNTITVDRNDLVMEVGKTYYIQVSNSNTDEQVYVPITSVLGDVLTTSSTLGVLGAYSVYSFGEVDRHAKKMRVLSISTAGDLKRKITAVEYNENVYNDAVAIPAPLQVQDLRTKDLVASEYMRIITGGAIDTVVQLSWKGAALNYNVSYRLLTETSFTSAGIARTTSTEIYGLIEGELYEFMVDGITTQYRVLGKTTPPDPVINLVGSEFSNTFKLSWDYPYIPVDFNHFEIYADGVLLGSSITTSFSEYIPTIKSVSFTVVAVDSSGNHSTPVGVIVTPQGLQPVTGLKAYYINEQTRITWDILSDTRSPIDYEIRMGTIWDDGLILGRVITPEYTVSANGTYMVKAHYQYPNGTNIYSVSESQITIVGAMIPKNIVASFNEKTTGWLGTKTNVYVNADGNLELMSDPLDTIPVIDSELVFDYAGGIQAMGIYEIPAAHIVDIGTAQVCRLWVDYKAEGRIVTDRVDNIFNFDSWVSVDGRSSDYNLIPQIAIAQDDGVFGPWEDFVVGDYIGRKFKFRGIFISLSADTTCILSEATFYIDMPDKLQSANNIIIPNTGTTITYQIPFQVPPNVQITIVSAQDNDDVILTSQTINGFGITISNGGVAVQRNINWLAKGY